MNKIIVKVAGAIISALLIASPMTGAAKTLRFAGNFPVDHPATGGMKVFKEEVEKATDGELKVELFPAMQLGGASQNIDQVRSGTIFATIASIAYFSRIVPEYEAISLPFMFQNRKQAFALVEGPVGQRLNKKVRRKGFVNLGYMELGFRNVTNDVRPIKEASDLEGLKIRLQPIQVHLDTFRALGVNPVSMDIQELYSALQQGVIDGQENPYDTIYTRRFFEVQKYLSNTKHFYDFIGVFANKTAYEELSEAHRDVVDEAMRKAVKWQRHEAKRMDLKWREKLIKNGMEYDEIGPDVREELKRKTKNVIEGVKERVGSDFVEFVQKNLKN